MPPPERPMNGKVCVITGASSGIGKAASLALARLGADVILVCRDKARGEAALAEVGAVAPASIRQLELADLSSLRDVRELAGRLSRLDRLDVLINNAGLVLASRQVSADGFEYTFALNHLAPFLLTGLLREKLAASAPARVVTVSSAAHRAARLDLADLQLTGHFNGWRAYANSKLANILFTRELASRLAGTGVTANSVRPRRQLDAAVRPRHRPPVPAVRRPGRGHRGLPRELAGRGGRDRRILRQAQAPRAIRRGQGPGNGPAAVGDQRGAHRPGRIRPARLTSLAAAGQRSRPGAR